MILQIWKKDFQLFNQGIKYKYNILENNHQINILQKLLIIKCKQLKIYVVILVYYILD